MTYRIISREERERRDVLEHVFFFTSCLGMYSARTPIFSHWESIVPEKYRRILAGLKSDDITDQVWHLRK